MEREKNLKMIIPKQAVHTNIDTGDQEKTAKTLLEEKKQIRTRTIKLFGRV